MGKYGFRKGKEREYSSYRSMRTRVENPNHEAHSRYEKLSICKRWLGDAGFENFYNDLGPRPDGCTLDRIDNAKGYSPENCAWRSVKQQGNNRSTNVLIEYNGKKLTLAQWSEELGMKYSTLHERLRRGMPVEQAFTQPLLKRIDVPEKLPNGVTRKMVSRRIKKLHWSKEDALTVPKQKNQHWKF